MLKDYCVKACDNPQTNYLYLDGSSQLTVMLQSLLVAVAEEEEQVIHNEKIRSLTPSLSSPHVKMFVDKILNPKLFLTDVP